MFLKSKKKSQEFDKKSQKFGEKNLTASPKLQEI